jgi:hypothetical protein
MIYFAFANAGISVAAIVQAKIDVDATSEPVAIGILVDPGAQRLFIVSPLDLEVVDHAGLDRALRGRSARPA